MAKDHSALPKPKVRSVALNDIGTDPATFQPRSVKLNHGHVAALARVLDNGEPLDPLEVREEPAGVYTVLDGHHSLEAYRASGWTKRVPVRAYRCTVGEGQRIAARENFKSRLQVDDEDRRDWAWKLTCDQPELSKSQVAIECSVGNATVGRMRRVRKELMRFGHELPASWSAAQCLLRGDELQEWTEEVRAEWRSVAREKLKANIARDIVQYSVGHPDLVIEVVQEVMGRNRFTQGAEYLGFYEAELNEITGELTRPESLCAGDAEPF